MSRKFRIKLLAVSLLAFGAMTIGTIGLTSCQPEPDPDPQPQPEPEAPVLSGVTGVEITNVDALQATWDSTGANRKVELALTGGDNVNINAAIMDKSIELSSSDTHVALVSGLYIMPGSYDGGTATITVTVHTDKGDVTTSVDVTIGGIMEAMDPKAVYDAAVGSTVAFNGKVLADYSADEVYGLFVGAGEYSFFVYRAELPDGISVGDGVYVTGKTDVYNGGFQIASALILPEQGDYEEPVSLGNLTSLEGIDGYDTGREVELTGTISDFSIDEKYGNVEFDITIASGDAIYVKADSRYVSQENLDALGALKDGDTATIGGYSTFYVSGSKELPKTSEGFQVVNPWVVE